LNIAVNESISHPLQRCSVISNFVNTINKECFFQELESRKEIAFVGRLSHEKGPDIFAEITQGLNHSISMYGDGEMMESLKQQYPHIKFKGMCDMEKNWKNIRVLVMTSRYEGLPLAALEAMARGIPVIASTAGALPKLINDCKVGKSLAIENVSEFQDEIEKLMLQENNLYSKQGVKLIQFIDKYFSRKKNIPKIFNQYKIAVGLKAIS
jgi:glycosyltransferase involved in cell wall biosynthesis